MLLPKKQQALGYVDKAVQIGSLVVGAVLTVLYVSWQSNEEFLYILSNGSPPILALFASSMAACGVLKHEVRGDWISRAWLGYASGMVLWLLGETTWAVYSLLLQVAIPFPSVADVFWIAGYVPLLAALLIQAWPFRELFSKSSMRIAITVAFVLAALLIGLLIPPTFMLAESEDFATLFFDLAYPLLDVALLVVAMPIFLAFRKGTFWRPFLFIILGLGLTFVGDILFSWATLNELYYNGSYLELFYLWSYLTLAYGFYLRCSRGSTRDMLG